MNVPKEPIPIALSFSNDGRITSITTAREGAVTIDAEDGCTLGMWIEVNTYENLLADANSWREFNADEDKLCTRTVPREAL